ncbi:MAG: hypothetical protein KJ645_02960, partial [Planctomycetes bacterium]|nr:hypothetical protein [Planctomycetota bacterium]
MMQRMNGVTRQATGQCRVFLLFGAIVLMLAAGPPVMAQAGNDSLSYSFSFEAPQLKACEVSGQSFSSIAMPGALTIGRNVGEPALPVQFVQILLPAGKEVLKINVTGDVSRPVDTSRLNLMERPIFPQQKPIPIGQEMLGVLEMNPQVYGSTARFPAEDFGGEQVGYCRGYAILSLGLVPVKYVPAKGSLSWYSEMTVEIELKDSTETSRMYRGKASDRAWVERLVCNPEISGTYGSTGKSKDEYPGGLCDAADDYDYVIITTTQNGLDDWATSPSTPYNWDSLMAHHSTVSGLTCTLVTIQEILANADYQDPNPLFNDTPARIREFCKDAYLDWGTDYLLIGGDDEWIPAREMDSNVEYDMDSDIYWNHLDNNFNANGDSYWGEEGDAGFDQYAELYIGRLTCDVPQDVSNWMKKSLYYANAADTDYLDNAAFYGGDTGWDCQGDDFIDYSAIKGTDYWIGPNPTADPLYPAWLGFQYGFETWNSENPGQPY